VNLIADRSDRLHRFTDALVTRTIDQLHHRI
jgi:hypothetical protein